MAADEKSPATDNGGLFISHTISHPNHERVARTPLKSQPMGRLQEGETINSDVRKVAETVKKVNPASLSAYATKGESLIEKGMNDKLSTCPDNAIKFCFWLYSGSYPISKTDAQRIVELSEQYSSVITPPLQHDLLRAYIYDDVEAEINHDDEKVTDINPDLLRLYRISIERFFEAAEDSEKELLAPIPLLSADDEDFMKDLLLDYETFNDGINMLCFNFLRKKPTSPIHREIIRKLVGHMRRMGYFDATLKYAINVLHSYKENDKFRSAEDLALAGMGFDIIGENHWRPQSDYSGDWEVNFRLFRKDIMSYWEVPNIHGELSDYWPDGDETRVDINGVFGAERDREIWRIQRIINAEQEELALSDLRDAIDLGETQEFVERYTGLIPLKESFGIIASEYDDPSTQSSFNEY